MLHFLEETGGSGSGSGLLSTLIMLAIMVAIFYFMLIRPESKRKKQAEQMRSDMKVGDKVTTIGGINGKVVDIKEEKFVIETGADQVRIEFSKWALSTNETGTERAKEEAQRAAAAAAQAKAEKKANKGKK